jgi:hypothetical protein
MKGSGAMNLVAWYRFESSSLAAMKTVALCDCDGDRDT